jgi:H+/Cl- antiporter ClcA
MEVTLNIYASEFSILGVPSSLIYRPPSRTSAQWRMVNSLLLATFIRTLLVIISYGCKVPAGIFVPSMAIGATFGRMIGIIVKALYRLVVPLRRGYQFTFLRSIGHTLLLACSPFVNLTSLV